ncbi:MAG: hypothetical protein J0M24_00310 [Verrucomicrobia bacterium]|jgi:hypothetical protein|nr:hypothetical protein [Verrucomicrobiota bacterium]
MNSTKKLSKTILGTSTVFALAIALLGAGCASNSSTSQMKPMKGGEHLLMLQGISTAQEANALQSNDSIAMVCGKCQTVWVSRAKQGVKGAQLLTDGFEPKELIGTHACAGCNSTLTVVGHAKGDITELKHSCTACGDDSAFCCATKPASVATKGMEKDKK